MKWKTLQHNGVAFPPDYDYRGLQIRIKGEVLRLDPEKQKIVEEMLMAWAKKKDTVYVQDPVFQQNFLGDLKRELGPDSPDFSLSDIDWTELYAIVDREKTANLSPEEKKRRSAERKAVREALKAKFGQAIVDDVETEIGAYLVEPPGILMGRGAHPLRGKWKARVLPEEVTLNLDEDCPVPPAPEGHQWGKIVHDHDSMWVASWFDKLSQKRKYVWLADSSNLRQERDKAKYVKATKLESGLEKVRAKIRAGMNYEDRRARVVLQEQARASKQLEDLRKQIFEANEAGDTETQQRLEDKQSRLLKKREKLEKKQAQIQAAEMKTRQIATVCYLIDRLAMRVGDEKDEDEADTVGASTLRVEHIHIHPDRIEFDFLGKDSVQWNKALPLSGKDKVLARNFEDFTRGKQPGEQVFDKIGSTHVNKFLSNIVPGLTAKVFRTYHATTTVRDFLGKKGQFEEDAALFEKEYIAKLANLEAAITCNHKRTPPKNWEQNLANKEAALQQLRAAKPDLTKFVKEREKREAALEKLLKEQEKLEADGPRAIREKEAALAELQASPEPADEKERERRERRSASAQKALDKAKADFEKKKQRLIERIAKAQAALARAREAPARAQADYAERVRKAERQLELAKATRDYNLGTSLKNYIDPRVYKAWGDHVGYDWKRLYTKSLQRKFAWVSQSHPRWNGDAAAAEVVEEPGLEEMAEKVAEN